MEVVPQSQLAQLSRNLAELAELVTDNFGGIAKSSPDAELKSAVAQRVRTDTLALAEAHGIRIADVVKDDERLATIETEYRELAARLLAASPVELTTQRANDIRDLVADVRKEAQRETHRLRTECDEHRVHSDGSLEEIRGLIRAVDREHERSQKRVTAWQSKSEELVSELSEGLIKVAETARSEAGKTRGVLEDKIAAQVTEFKTDLANLKDNVHCETEKLANKHSRCAAELHRMFRGVEHRIIASGREQEEATKKVMAHIETCQTANDQQTEQRCLKLREALRLQHTEFQKADTEAAERSKKQTDEVRVNLLGQIEVVKAAHARHAAALEARIDAVSGRVDATMARIDETKRSTDERVDLLLSALSERLSCRTDAVCEEHSMSMQQFQLECAEEFHSTRRAAEDACHSVTACLSRQLEHQFAEVTELSRQMRSEVDKGIGDLRSQILTSEHETLRRVDSDITASKQAVVAQAAQQAHEVVAMREALASECATQARRTAQLEDRLDCRLRQSADEMASALHASSEELFRVRESLDSGLRESLVQAERRIQECVAGPTDSFSELEASVQDFRAETAVKFERTLESTIATELLAQQAKRTAFEAEARIAGLGAATQVAMSDFRSCLAGDDENTLAEARAVISSLAAGLLKLAQCCGFVGDLGGVYCGAGVEFGDSAQLAAERISLKELLEWERSGAGLAKRIEQSWLARSRAVSPTLLGLISRKADASALQIVQAAMRDLEARVLRALPADLERQPRWREVDPGVCVHIGEPFAGPFGAQARSRKGEMSTTSESLSASWGNSDISYSQPHKSWEEQTTRTPSKPSTPSTSADSPLKRRH